MRDAQEERLSHPLPPFLHSLGVAGGTEPARLAGEGQEMSRPAAWAPDAGEPAAGIAAVEVALHRLLDDRPEKSVLLLKATLIHSQEPVEMMEKHPVENGPLRISGTIESRHSGREASRNGPTSQIEPRLPGKRQ